MTANVPVSGTMDATAGAAAKPARVAVVGATGYTGMECLRYLAGHPGVHLCWLGSASHAGEPVAEALPALAGLDLPVLSAPDPRAVAGRAEVAILALPHGAAMEWVPPLLEAGLRVIDLGADFRLRDPDAYARWYHRPHQAPALLAGAAYGLAEHYAPAIARAGLVANPGCYPTAVALPLVPLLAAGLVSPDGIIVDAKSGVSGAGRAPAAGVHFCEVHENLRPYQVAGTHRHLPEMEQVLGDPAGRPVALTFTPHLVPMVRGILATIYATPVPGVGAADLQAALEEAYASSPFVRVLPPGRLPETRHVRGSNFADLAVAVDGRTGRAILTSAIDNLGKGAAGQAVQNLNLMLGWPETWGLEARPVVP